MKHLKGYKLFENKIEPQDIEELEDCFVEIKDKWEMRPEGSGRNFQDYPFYYYFHKASKFEKEVLFGLGPDIDTDVVVKLQIKAQNGNSNFLKGDFLERMAAIKDDLRKDIDLFLEHISSFGWKHTDLDSSTHIHNWGELFTDHGFIYLYIGLYKL